MSDFSLYLPDLDEDELLPPIDAWGFGLSRYVWFRRFLRWAWYMRLECGGCHRVFWRDRDRVRHRSPRGRDFGGFHPNCERCRAKLPEEVRAQ